MKSLGLNLALLRSQKNLTQAQVGAAAGLRKSYVSDLERGLPVSSGDAPKSPTLRALDGIVRALGGTLLLTVVPVSEVNDLEPERLELLTRIAGILARDPDPAAVEDFEGAVRSLERSLRVPRG